MCGFAGLLSSRFLGDSDRVTTILQAMAAAIANRGPDSGGQWLNIEDGIGLAHRRLAIVDLSDSGTQPMLSSSGRFVIAFNGEVYNHSALRTELDSGCASQAWRGYSDTETLLAGIEAWGLSTTLSKCIGMFALALWDRESRSLYLARDRMGEKPLYYGWQGEDFLFGSELKALKACPLFNGEIDRDAIALFVQYSYIPAPYSIYKGVRKLPPGCILKIQVGNSSNQEVPQPYWSLVDTALACKATPFRGERQEAVNLLEKLLKESVRGQMMADVPLGAFLSGGVDSSTVVALMQAESSRPVKTFTVGFNETGYNEAHHAQAVARYLGTEHTELYVTPAQAQEVIPLLPMLYDEPFADISQIPNFLISKLARQQVTVSLSGDGGDELFGGYSRYARSRSAWGFLEKIPRFMRNRIAKTIQIVPVSAWNYFSVPIKSFLPARAHSVGDTVHKFSGVLGARNEMELYKHFMTHWERPEAVVIGASALSEHLFTALPREGGHRLNYFESMMLADSLVYLPDDILVKVDRAAMGVSLETRVPLLDHRIVEFAWSLPLDYKIYDGVTKWPLRQVLDRYVPKELIDRPKMGFSVPIGEWLRGRLRNWAEELLDENRLRKEGFFDPKPIRQKWVEHLSGQRNWQYHLWDILMFQAWLQEN